ncbi:hypothetical protein Tco_0844909 [Tanacetum coccineum]
MDWITIRRADDKLYSFKEGDFKRLRLQDIEDMLILLVQGKLTNLKVKEFLTFSVALRMFTRSIVIQRLVKDLQFGVESYQKKLNITKSDIYRSDLRRREAYTAYPNPRGFIYQNRDKKNRLMPLDELNKFSDGTLNDVRTTLDDRLKDKMDSMHFTLSMYYDYGAHVKGELLVTMKNFQTGNPVKEILLKLNLPDHRILKDGSEDKEFQRSFRHSDTERLSRSGEVLKLKNFKKDATLKLFKSTNQERYEHVGPEVTSSQDGKVYKMAKRDYAWLMISM